MALPLQGSTPALQGSSNTIQRTAQPGGLIGPPKPVGVKPKSPILNVTKPTNTLPPGQVAPRDFSSTHGLYNLNGNPTVYNKATNAPYHSDDEFKAETGISSIGQKFDTAYVPPATGGTPPSPSSVPTPTPPPPDTTPYTPPNKGTTGVSQGGIIGNLINIANNESPQVSKARSDLKALEENYGQATADIESRPEGLTQQTGQQGILNRLFATKQAAGQTALSSALTSQGQGITANQVAGGLNAPITGVAYGTQQFSPSLPLNSSGQVQPTDPFYKTMSTYAQSLAANQPAAIPSSITSNPALQAQLLEMAKAINPNFNFNTAQGIGAAQQSNAQIGGTAGTTAAQGVFNQSYSDYNTLQNSVQNIDQFGALLTKTMADGGINPSDVKYANARLADIRNQLSSAQQAVYDNTLASLRSRVSGLLSAGGDQVPTQVTSDANKILDGTLPLSSLSAVLGRIQQEGQVLLQNKGKIVNDNFNRIQGGGQSPSNATNTQTLGLF